MLDSLIWHLTSYITSFIVNFISRLTVISNYFQIHQVIVKDRKMARQRRRAFLFFMRPDTHVVLKPLDGSDTYPPTSLAEIQGTYYNDVTAATVWSISAIYIQQATGSSACACRNVQTGIWIAKHYEPWIRELYKKWLTLYYITLHLHSNFGLAIEYSLSAHPGGPENWPSFQRSHRSRVAYMAMSYIKMFSDSPGVQSCEKCIQIIFCCAQWAKICFSRGTADKK